MKGFFQIIMLLGLVLLGASCADNSRPNYQYMPNMYEPVGYETYQEVDWLPEGTSALTPPENSIKRGWLPYEFSNDQEGKELARAQQSPLDSLNREENLAKGKELYDIYCAICHGNQGKGQGELVKREKILGVPSYADAARNITAGSTYHTIYYGLNSMGSYAGQMNFEERWMVSEYVMELKNELTQ